VIVERDREPTDLRTDPGSSPVGLCAARPAGFWTPGRKYMRLVTTSLLLSDGSPAESMGLPLSRRRFRCSSNRPATRRRRPAQEVAKRKVFEFVREPDRRGASPGARVSLSIQLVTNRGRLLRYEDRGITDSTGHFAFTMPYATDQSRAPGPATRPLGRAQLSADGRMTEIEVPEDAVLSGRSLTVVLPRPAPRGRCHSRHSAPLHDPLELPYGRRAPKR
jgi:hypothetical protein